MYQYEEINKKIMIDAEYTKYSSRDQFIVKNIINEIDSIVSVDKKSCRNLEEMKIQVDLKALLNKNELEMVSLLPQEFSINNSLFINFINENNENGSFIAMFKKAKQELEKNQENRKDLYKKLRDLIFKYEEQEQESYYTKFVIYKKKKELSRFLEQEYLEQKMKREDKVNKAQKDLKENYMNYLLTNYTKFKYVRNQIKLNKEDLKIIRSNKSIYNVSIEGIVENEVEDLKLYYYSEGKKSGIKIAEFFHQTRNNSLKEVLKKFKAVLKRTGISEEVK